MGQWYWWFCFLFLTGSRLPTQPRAPRLTSAMPCQALLASICPIWVQAIVDGLKRSTCRESHHQSKNSTQNLISVVILIIASTGHHQLLVEVTSCETNQRPGKNLFCPEQHFWKVCTSRCICRGIIMMILIVCDCLHDCIYKNWRVVSTIITKIVMIFKIVAII